MRSVGFLLTGWIALALWGCGGTDGNQGSGGTRCDPGETRTCTCTDGSASTKICGESGTGYLPCQCALTDTAGPDDDTSSGTDASTGDDPGVGPDGCAPACGNRVCGPDGCGGSCGTCAGGKSCSPLGKCESVACGGGATTLSGKLITDLGAVDFTSVSATLTHKRDVDPYEDGCIVSIDLDFQRGDGCHFVVSAAGRVDDQHRLSVTQMALTADSQCPGFPDDAEGTYHVKGSLMLGDVNPGVAKVPDANAASSCFHGTMTVRLAGVIEHDQTGDTLTLFESTLSITGDFTSQGSMSADCPCAATCAGRECGSDGCGGTCGACGCGEECESGLCRFHNCDGKQCGSDGCGGSCGACTAGPNAKCGETGQCTCTKSCTNKQCGDDGCGGACGTCASGKTCNASGQCVAGTCTPDCGDIFSPFECGPNGCGGTCGTCAAGATCVSGTCVAGDEPGCVAKSTKGCGGCACEECACDQDNYCCTTKWDSTCVELCTKCGSCGGCQPSCVDLVGQVRECGDDGCGGSCGSCSGGKTCNSAGHCVVPGSGDWGAECASDEDCQADLVCGAMLGLGGGLPGASICTQECTPFIGVCPEGWICFPASTDMSTGVCMLYPM